MKKLMVLLLIAMMIIAAVGCSTPAQTSTATTKPAETTTAKPSETTTAKPVEKQLIGITTSMYANEGLAMMCDTMKGIFEDAGYTATIIDSKMDAAKQISDVEDLINQGAVLIIGDATDSVGFKPALEACQKAKVPFVSVSQLLDESIKGMAIANVVADNYTAGLQVGEEFAKRIGKKGKVCMYTLEVAFVCRERARGFRDAIKNYPDIEIIEEYDGPCTEEDGMKATENWMQKYPDLAGIFGHNTNVGLGIAAAVDSAGKAGKIVVANVDGFAGEMKAIERGSLTITAVYPMVELATAGAEISLEYLKTGKAGESPSLAYPICTKENLDTYMKYWGMK